MGRCGAMQKVDDIIVMADGPDVRVVVIVEDNGLYGVELVVTWAV